MRPIETDRSLNSADADSLLAALCRQPKRSAIVCDIDGTLAPIAARPEQAAVPEATGELLRRLEQRYALVACVSGRRAADARRLVGVEEILYVGNHGLERLAPGAGHADVAPQASDHIAELRSFAGDALQPAVRDLGVRLEDKDSILAFHWRGADDELTARVELERLANTAKQRGLLPHWGRKVLEIRPPLDIDKGTAVTAALNRTELEQALYAGDDTTDLDAFRRLRELRSAGALKHAICVGVRSDEGPAEITAEADLVADGTNGLVSLLAKLAS